MTLRPLRELADSEDADEALASRLACAFPDAPAANIPLLRAAPTTRPWMASWILRPAFVLALLAVAAAASAMVGGIIHLSGTRKAALAPPAAQARPAQRQLAAERPIDDELPAPVLSPTLPAPVYAPRATRASSLPSPVETQVPANDPSSARPERPVTATSLVAEAPVAAALPPSEDFALLVDAMRALRSEHDPARASALVASYVERHPQGALLEEALAIRVEAAVAGDDSRAAANEYLTRFPTGRYAAAAKRALGHAAP